MKIEPQSEDSLWKECVEFFFRPDLESPVYYQFAAGANGKFEAMRFSATGNQDKAFQSKAVCNVSRAGNGYSVEMQIPGSEIGLDKFEPGMAASANFTRTGASCGGLSTWAPVGSSFHNSERFGKLIFGSRKAYFSRCLTEMKRYLHVKIQQESRKLQWKNNLTKWKSSTISPGTIPPVSTNWKINWKISGTP